jgi:glutaconate CoA-transferase, subunit B
LSGLGHHPARREGQGPRYLISDLGQFDFGGGLSLRERDDCRMRLISLHEEVTLRRLQAKTGFHLILPDPIPTTPPPTAEELRLLREVIDPLGVRQLETLRGAGRRQKLREILQAEKALMRV